MTVVLKSASHISVLDQSVGFCRGSRVECRGSWVSCRGSRVKCRGSRVVFFIVFFNFGRKIFRLSGIYRNASLFVNTRISSFRRLLFHFHVCGDRRRVISLVCFACSFTGGPSSLQERRRDSCLRAALCYKRLFTKACMGCKRFFLKEREMLCF